MSKAEEIWNEAIGILQAIRSELHLLYRGRPHPSGDAGNPEYVHVPFKGNEIYLLHKAFIDAGGASHENYKSMLEKTLCHLSNKTQRGFSPQSFLK